MREPEQKIRRFVVISGYFNPIHSGHIDYIKSAKELGDALIVIVNNDEQVKMKGSVPFQDQEERLKIVSNIKGVDHAVVSVDKDATVCQSIRLIHSTTDLFMTFDEMIFCNGGDRKKGGVPEDILTEEIGVRMVYNVGGEKTQSSSELLARAEFSN